MLQETLKDKYKVDACFSANDAFRHIRSAEYDIVVTDLKLEDGSGIDVLKRAKQKDKFTEVIMITGYGSLQSASEAINLGVISYLNKPIKINDLCIQVERAVASRIFHLKSMSLIYHPTYKEVSGAKDHIIDLTSLYYFTTKLMVSFDVAEVMQVILEEVNDKLEAAFSVIGINYLDFSELFAMPRVGEINSADIIRNILSVWDESFNIFKKEDLKNKKIMMQMYPGKTEEAVKKMDNASFGNVITLPMTILGENIGFISLFRTQKEPLNEERSQFFYVFTTIISSAIQHYYLDMQAKEQAKTDGLTGVANHRMFHETLNRELSLLKRYKRKFSLAILDIDDFKNVNDTYGHLIGDAVLIDLTRRVTRIIRNGDILARYGGEEFAIILPDADISGAEVLANRICKEISQTPFMHANAEIYYSVSIGLVACNSDSLLSRDVIIGLADGALYKAKKNGKNRVEVHRSRT